MILWVSGLASAFIDNIPFTTMMIPVVKKLADNAKLDLPLQPLVWALALGACLGKEFWIILIEFIKLLNYRPILYQI